MAVAQQHRILRQVVELSGCTRGQAAALQAAAARLCRRDWWPAIERVCSAQVDAGRVLRIDRLQIDLGRLAPATWLAAAGPQPGSPAAGVADTAADGLLQQFEGAFRAALSHALRDADEVQTDAELLATFLRSGALPWWADAGDRDAVRRAATTLQRQPAAAWRGWLGGNGGAAPDEVALQRLVAAVPDDLCRGLLTHWRTVDRASGAGVTDGPPDLDDAWLAAIDRAALEQGQSPLRWRRAWWQAAMTACLWPDAAADRREPAGLASWLRQLGVPRATARQALRQALAAPSAAGQSPARAALWQALEPQRRGASSSVQEADQALQPVLEALRRLAQREADPRAAQAWRHLVDRLIGPAGTGPGPTPRPWAGLPQAVRERLADAWYSATAAAGAARADHRRDLADALQAWLAAAQHRGLVDLPAHGSALAGDGTPGEALARHAAAWADAALAGSSDARSAPPQVATAAAVEALYLHNAGLVLLWPFIQRFVDRLGLLQPDSKPARWRDAASARRAAVLLQCVISGDAEPPEYQLLLPKLLCGLPLETPLVLDEPLDAAEQAECEAVLVAAIAQATVLRQMSVGGFRASFGLRAGQLSTRDGHWLLRVERQAYDVVIDRFPWSASLVRLPWMPSLLQVQW